MKKLFILSAIMLLILSGCHKDNNEDDNPKPDPVKDTVKVEKVQINEKDIYLLDNEELMITYAYWPDNADVSEVSLTSNDESICTIEDFTIMPKGEGDTSITLTIDGISTSADVSIRCPRYYGEAPEVIDNPGLTYIDGILIANKTYTLPSDYDPDGIITCASNAFKAMAKAALEDGVELNVRSGYRSYSYQKKLYQKYVDRDGKAAADTYSARAGHSEHQTGLAMDINSLSQSWGQTKEGKWLKKHCSEFGFIIRYPEGKEDITGYLYEPWHVRYLGTKLALKVTESGLTLEEYLGIDSRYAE